MRLSISGYSRFLLFSFSLSWLALYGGLPMMTLILRLFWRLMRSTFSSLTLPNRSSWWPRVLCAGPTLSSVSTKQRFGNSSYSPVMRGVGRLDVQVGDVVGQDRHLVGVQLLPVLVLELRRLAAEVLDQLADEGAGAGGRVEDLDVLVDQAACRSASRRASRRSRS